MTPRTVSGRAFAITLIALSPLVYFAAVGDAKSAPTKEAPCILKTFGPNFAKGKVGYTAAAYCPNAQSILWKLTINRSGLPWASNSGSIITLPRVSKKCVRSGPPITLRPILRVTVYYSPNAIAKHTFRGAVTSTRCAE